MTATTVYRSPLTSVGTFIEVFALSCIAVGLALAAASTVGFPGSAIGPALLVPLAFATWRAWRLSIRIEGSTIVIRNPWRDHRVDEVHAASTGRNWSARGLPCLAFVRSDGRAITAIAGTIWLRGVFVERPGRTIEELAWFICEVQARQPHRLRLALPDVLRTAMRDLRNPIAPDA